MATTSSKAAPDLTILGNNSQAAWHKTWLPNSYGLNDALLYQQMRDRDPVIGGVFLALDSLFRQVEWQEVPASDHPDALAWAAFLKECREDMSHTWTAFITSGMSMLTHGWSYFEKVYKIRRGPEDPDPAYRSKYRDGRIGWRKLAERPQTTLNKWAFDDDGSIQGMWQRTKDGPVFIPIQKALLFRTTEASGLPEGRSLLVNARESYRFQTQLERFEAVGIERDLAGLPLIEVPPDLLNIDPDDPPEVNAKKRQTLAAMMDMGQGVRQDERAFVLMPSSQMVVEEEDLDTNEVKYKVVPTGYKFSLITSGGTRAHDTDKIIKRYSQRISASLLSTFLLLGGSEGGGNQALSGNLTDFFLLAATGILDGMADVVNRHGVAELMRLNGVPPEHWPELKHTGLTKESVGDLIDRLVKLVGEGIVTPDADLEAFMRDRLEVPKKSEKVQGVEGHGKTGQNDQGSQDKQNQDQQGQGGQDNGNE